MFLASSLRVRVRRRRRRVRRVRRVRRRNPACQRDNSNKYEHFFLIPAGMEDPTTRKTPIVARPNPISNMFRHQNHISFNVF